MAMVNLVLIIESTTFLPKNGFLDGGDFVSYLRSDYPSMSHSNKEISFSSLSMRRDDVFITSGNGRGDADPNKANLSSHKFDLSTYRHGEGFQPSQFH